MQISINESPIDHSDMLVGSNALTPQTRGYYFISVTAVAQSPDNSGTFTSLHDGAQLKIKKNGVAIATSFAKSDTDSGDQDISVPLADSVISKLNGTSDTIIITIRKMANNQSEPVYG